MRRARRYEAFEKVIVPNTVTRCLCGQPVSFAYRSDRHLTFLRGGQHVFYDVVRCANAGCPPYYPEAVTLHALPCYGCSLEVLARIGSLRFRENLPRGQIARRLREEHKIQISERHVENLIGVYTALLSTSIEKDPARLEKLRQQGRMVLSLDAAQPESDGESLWVLRDVLSGEVLLAFSCLGLDTPGMVRKLEAVKALGIPIMGVVSDAQNILCYAVEQALPGVPHQLCQFHFLRDLAKVVNRADRELKSELQKQLKGLRQFERAATQNGAQDGSKPIYGPSTFRQDRPVDSEKRGPGRPTVRVPLERPLSKAEAQLVGDVCELVRAILKTPGRHPLEAPGVQVHESVHKVLQLLEEAIPEKRGLACSGNSAGI